MSGKRQIVLVDDHVVVRNGLKELIEKLGDYEVCRQFDDGESFLESLPFKPAVDLVLLDLSLPGKNGDEIMVEMRNRNDPTPVLVLTLNREEETIVKLFRNGARGYLPKDCTANILKTAIEEILRCGYYHNEFLTMSLMSGVTTAKKSEQQKVLEQLTSREKEFLSLVCDGNEYTYEQIADIMGVQHRTVDGYRESLFEKFAIKSKTGLVLFVLKHRLMDHLKV